MKKLVCSVLFLGVIGMFSAQEKESEISEITVQGKFLNLPLKKVNENITVISKQELENSPAKSIEEVFDIGIEEYLDNAFLCIIEWPEIYEEELADFPHHEIKIENHNPERWIDFR